MSGRPLLAAVLAVVAGLSIGGCGSSSAEFSDQDIVKALHLERLSGDYALPGTFCRVADLYTSSDEVSQARQDNAKKLVIASRQGNVGIKIAPPFSGSCGEKALAGLNKLDKPKKK